MGIKNVSIYSSTHRANIHMSYFLCLRFPEHPYIHVRMDIYTHMHVRVHACTCVCTHTMRVTL